MCGWSYVTAWTCRVLFKTQVCTGCFTRWLSAYGVWYVWPFAVHLHHTSQSLSHLTTLLAVSCPASLFTCRRSVRISLIAPYTNEYTNLNFTIPDLISQYSESFYFVSLVPYRLRLLAIWFVSGPSIRNHVWLRIRSRVAVPAPGSWSFVSGTLNYHD